MKERKSIPVIENKAHGEPSVFLPENLLREARRQKGIPEGKVPEICVLDRDGDLADYLIEKGYARNNSFRACSHSHMYTYIFISTKGILMFSNYLNLSACHWKYSCPDKV